MRKKKIKFKQFKNWCMYRKGIGWNNCTHYNHKNNTCYINFCPIWKRLENAEEKK